MDYPRRKKFLTAPKVFKIPASTKRRMESSIVEHHSGMRRSASTSESGPSVHLPNDKSEDQREIESVTTNIQWNEMTQGGDNGAGIIQDEMDETYESATYKSNETHFSNLLVDANSEEWGGANNTNPSISESNEHTFYDELHNSGDSYQNKGDAAADLEMSKGSSSSASQRQSHSDNGEAERNQRVYHPLKERRITEGVEPDDLPTSSDDDEDCTACYLEEDRRQPPEYDLDNEEQAPPTPHQKLVDLLQGPYSERITINVTATRGDLLEMALAHRHQNRLPNKAFKDSINLVNAAFASPVIPDALHLIDNLLSDDSVLGIERHFFCDKCHSYFGEVDHTVVNYIQCTNDRCRANNFVGNLTEARYFVLFDIVPQLQLLLQEDNNYLNLKNPTDCIRPDNYDTLNDITDGSMYQNFAKSLNDDGHSVLTITVGTDGAPRFKCGGLSLWPIFLIINELEPVVRMRHTVFGGLWFGKDTPSMDMFLQKFVARISPLSNGFGMSLGGVIRRFKLFVIAASVDSGIRGAIQGIKAHGGYASCNWCGIIGVWDGDAVKYPNEMPEPPLRTHDTLRECAMRALNRDYPRGLDDRNKAIVLKGAFGLSALDGLPKFDNVDSFIVEYLHAVLLGHVRRLVSLWKDRVINAVDLATVEDNIEQKLSPPVELRRLLRKLEDWKDWKGRDWENFLLQFAVPLLHNVLPRRKMNHFSLLIQAIFFLLKRTGKIDQYIVAGRLLELYVAEVEEIYGVHEMTFNVHSLTHLARNCALWGGLWTSSAFPFENAIGELKKIIHSAGGVPHQVCRHISEKHALKLLKVHCSSAKTRHYTSQLKKQPVKKGFTVGSCHYFGVASYFDPSPDEAWLCDQKGIDPAQCFVYEKIIKDKCLYTSRKKTTDNTVAITTDNDIVVIQKIILHERNNGFVFVKKVACTPFFQFPREIVIPLQDHCVRKVTLVVDELFLLSVTSLESICCRTNLDGGDFIALLPNLFNVF